MTRSCPFYWGRDKTFSLHSLPTQCPFPPAPSTIYIGWKGTWSPQRFPNICVVFQLFWWKQRLPGKSTSVFQFNTPLLDQVCHFLWYKLSRFKRDRSTSASYSLFETCKRLDLAWLAHLTLEVWFIKDVKLSAHQNQKAKMWGMCNQLQPITSWHLMIFSSQPLKRVTRAQFAANPHSPQSASYEACHSVRPGRNSSFVRNELPWPIILPVKGRRSASCEGCHSPSWRW